jgi:hypothetical protein
MLFSDSILSIEAEKWKVYMTVASSTRTVEQIEPMGIIIEENDDLPIAKPSSTGPLGHPAPLDFSDFSGIFDERLRAPTPGQKRKLGHRLDSPPIPPSPRLPPPIFPTKHLNHEILLFH